MDLYFQGMAWVLDANVAIGFFTDDRAARFAAAEAAATDALSLAPEHALAHLCMGIVLGFTNRAVQGIAEFERALALDRNLAGAHSLIGQNKLFIGRGEETEAHVQEALRLSPRDPWVYTWLVTAGVAMCLLGRAEEAISWLRRSIETNRNYPLCHEAVDQNWRGRHCSGDVPVSRRTRPDNYKALRLMGMPSTQLRS